VQDDICFRLLAFPLRATVNIFLPFLYTELNVHVPWRDTEALFVDSTLVSPVIYTRQIFISSKIINLMINV